MKKSLTFFVAVITLISIILTVITENNHWLLVTLAGALVIGLYAKKERIIVSK